MLVGKRAEIFSGLCIGSILVKYHYLAVHVFHVPSMTILVQKELLFLLAFLIFFHPLSTFRRGRRILVLFHLVFTVFFFLQVWYNRYFGNYLSLSALLMGRGFRPWKVLIFQLTHPSDLLWISDVILLLFLYFTDDVSSYLRTVRKTYLLPSLLILLLFTFHIGGGIQRFGNLGVKQLYAKSTPSFVNIFGILPLYPIEYLSLFHYHEFSSTDEEIITPPVTHNDLRGEALLQKGGNIIVIQLESIDANLIDFTYNGKEITPTLNSLKKRGLYFENYYAQHINGSFDAEFSLFTSLYPLNKHYGFKVNDFTAFDTLIDVLNNNEFTTLAFHGNDKSFFFRDKAYAELGFDRFYSKEDFDETRMLFGSATFGINDYDFFKQSWEFLATEEEPFFALLISATSHTPYDFYPKELEQEEFADITHPLLRGYFNSAYFLDISLGLFIEQLHSSGLLDNTLLILYGDHDAAIDRELYSSKRNFALSKSVKIPESIPLLMIHPNLEAGVATKECSPVDLAPTILDIIGERDKPSDFMGYSLLGAVEKPILFLHETPQLLSNGQLYQCTPEGIQQVGYVVHTGEKEQEISSSEYRQMYDYIRSIILDRRNEE